MTSDNEGPTRTYRAMRAFLNRMGIDRTMSKLSVSTTIGDATTYATDDPAMIDPELAARFHVDIEGVDVDSLWVQLLPFGIWLDVRNINLFYTSFLINILAFALETVETRVWQPLLKSPLFVEVDTCRPSILSFHSFWGKKEVFMKFLYIHIYIKRCC